MRDPRGPIDVVAALADPVRRRLYDYVASRGEPTGRDEAARASGIGRTLAAFHLDRLAHAGLLQISYRRLSGRSGPGAGRPAKLYARADAAVAVSVPPRNYELLADLLASGADEDHVDAATRAATKHGRQLGRDLRARARAGAAPGAIAEALEQRLRDEGFEPVQAEPGLRLRNCAFGELAARHPDVVCAMNLALMRGIASGLAGSGIRAIAARDGIGCCVAFATPE